MAQLVFMIRCLLLIGLLSAAGCAPTTPPVSLPRPTPDIPGHADFQAAEEAFDTGNYADAVEGYNAFLRNAYDSRFADAALFKIGKIYQFSGRDEDALAVFLRLIHEFPRGGWRTEAMVEILSILYSDGDYEAVVAKGAAFSDAIGPGVSRVPFYSMIADAFSAMGAHLEAARYRYLAWSTASTEEKPIAWSQLKSSVEQLGADDIQMLVTQVTDQDTMGFLLYRLGMAFILEEKYDDALDVLSAFIERYPDHPDYPDASDMVLSLVERSRFTPFTIGCVLPLSGPYALFGNRALEGIELALSRFGDKDSGLPFRILVKDSRSDPGVSASAVADLDQLGVGAILGPMSAAESAAAASQARGIPILVFTQREGVTDLGPYVFRNFITPQMQVQALVAYAVDEMELNRFGILYPDENYGQRYMHLFWDQVIAHGKTVNGVEAYDPEGTDFAKPIKKLVGIFYDRPGFLSPDSLPRPGPLSIDLEPDAQSRVWHDGIDPVALLTGFPLDREDLDVLSRRGPERDDQWHPIVDFDAIFIPDAPKKAGLVIPQLAYYDIRDVYLLGTNLWNSATLLEMSGDYMNHTVITDGFFAESQDETIKAFVTAFEGTYGRRPGIIEAMAYDSAMMILSTMRQTATDSRRDFKTALLAIRGFKGVSGETAFAPTGEAQKSLQMLRIERGRFVEAPRTAREPSVPTTQ